MKYFSTFSGIGGFELGIQGAFETTQERLRQESEKPVRVGATSWSDEGHEGLDGSTAVVLEHLIDSPAGQPHCVGYSEIDKYATKVYERHFPNHENYGDITKINADELPDFDCLVGGFPCQAFSIAGKRGGFDDTRGTLFFDLARILRAKQPRLFVFENVKGLLNHDSGRTFATIIQTIDELGYDCQWQVLNSKNHGVPQNRERVIIVGHLRGTRRPDVFPIEYNYGIQQPTITERVYYLQGDSASYARELVLGMAQQQGQEISREQMQELFKRTKQSLATGESTEVAEEREAIQSQPERDIQEVSSIGAFLGSENDTGGVLGVVSVPTENLLLLWSAAGDATDDTRQIQQQDISVDSGQSGLIETLRTYEHSPLLFAVQPYQGRLFYSVGDGANWTKLYSIKMEELCSPKNTLSSVLEEHPDPKYFLSQEQTTKILKSWDQSLSQSGQGDTSKSGGYTPQTA